MNTLWYKSISKTPVSKTAENYWYLKFYEQFVTKTKNTEND